VAQAKRQYPRSTLYLPGEPAAVNDHGEDARDDVEADTPGKGDQMSVPMSGGPDDRLMDRGEAGD
jgi:hypothetical protein